MINTPNDGGPAFPNKGSNTPHNKIYDGMTLRQWYKGQALQAIWRDIRYSDVGNEAANVHEVSRCAGRLADAMLAEDASFAERDRKP